MATENSAFHMPSEKVYYRFPVVVPYDSPIFVCVQNGDIHGMRELWRQGQASIDAVDPYGLGLLYYSTYYCWRSRGAATATAMSKALLEAGANCEWRDEIGNTPLETMTEAVLAESAMNGTPLSSLSVVAQLFGKRLEDLWREYKEGRRLTELHEVLLSIDRESETLADYLNCAATEGTLFSLINGIDACGRSALSWAVEHGWADAVNTLISFGADVHQPQMSIYGGLPMLHLALAGPNSGERGAAFLDIVGKLLLAGVDVNTADHEGWTPLHIAASWKDTMAIGTLIRFASQRLDWSAVTSGGETAAQLAANGGCDEALMELLVSQSASQSVSH